MAPLDLTRSIIEQTKVLSLVVQRGPVSFQQSSPPKVATLLAGIAMGESPRWHDNRLWLSDWGAREILAVDAGGRSEIMLRTPFELPFCIDWLPDGRLLIVAGRENRLVRWEPDGSLVTHADLRGVSDGAWNEIVVDGRGNAYVNGGPGIIALITADRLSDKSPMASHFRMAWRSHPTTAH